MLHTLHFSLNNLISRIMLEFQTEFGEIRFQVLYKLSFR